MSLTNILKDRVKIQVKTTTQTALGETVIWKPVETRYARVIPLDAAARAVYQQLQSQITHKVIFRDNVSILLGNNRILWGSKTLEPMEPVQVLGDKTSVVMVKEV